ncbi:MAG: Threonine efflux protein, partial [uncultured Ramlibacter sp.]
VWRSGLRRVCRRHHHLPGHSRPRQPRTDHLHWQRRRAGRLGRDHGHHCRRPGAHVGRRGGGRRLAGCLPGRFQCRAMDGRRVPGVAGRPDAAGQARQCARDPDPAAALLPPGSGHHPAQSQGHRVLYGVLSAVRRPGPASGPADLRRDGRHHRRAELCLRTGGCAADPFPGRAHARPSARRARIGKSRRRVPDRFRREARHLQV